jgi:2,4-dienoyl-CoA reductase (NADPH2)
VPTFPHLFAPGRLGALELRNRILMAPMGDALAQPDGTVSPTQLAYYEARARGGAALLLVGSAAVAYPRGSVDARQTAVSDDAQLPGLAELAARVHAHGAAIAAQLTHNGAMSLLDIERGEPLLVPAKPAPPHPDALTMMLTPDELAAVTSPFTTPAARVVNHVADDADLEAAIEQYAAAADRCRRAGFDGIEIHAGHGYLIDEFLTPSLNQRDDAWGGDTDRRARLLCEVIRAVRARVGAEYPVWIRVNAFERHKVRGEQFDDQLRTIELAVAAGIDAVHVTAYASTDVATGPTDTYVPHRVGDLAQHAAAVRAATGLPVITFGRFEPDEAEAVLAAGQADFVAMGRKLLADPDLPRRLAEGRPDAVRPCIYQYRCIGNIFVRGSVRCVANASTGREDEDPPAAAARPRPVLVVGGGPAGLEAARTLAADGHRVTVWEATERLGGALALAAGADPVLARYLAWLAGAVERAGVEIEVGRRADADAALATGAAAFVVATGAHWDRPVVPGAERALTVPDLRAWLDGDTGRLGARVVVLGGGKVGLTLALHAREQGRSVAVVEPGEVLAPELGLPGRFRMVADAEAAGVALHLGATLTAIDAGTVSATTAGGPITIEAETVIATGGRRPGAPLAAALRHAGADVHEVGDCRTVAGIEGANLDARRLATELRA